MDPEAKVGDGAGSEHGAHANSHRRSLSGANFLAKFPNFMRLSSDGNSSRSSEQDSTGGTSSSHAKATSSSSPKQTRRRRGSLRKVALLGRGAQRDKRETRALTIDTSQAEKFGDSRPVPVIGSLSSPDAVPSHGGADSAPRPVIDDGSGSSISDNTGANSHEAGAEPERTFGQPVVSYTSTTDEEDILQIPKHTISSHVPGLTQPSGSDGWMPNRLSIPRRRSLQRAKSPLSYSGLASTALPPPDAEWDYSETEWWGWVVLLVTWFVFVIGMGSCLGVWSWAWDVGTTPYAPPELEDDPTLPIVGYYPALIIMSCIMAWVWVVVAWVGMKYFRHAKISGD